MASRYTTDAMPGTQTRFRLQLRSSTYAHRRAWCGAPPGWSSIPLTSVVSSRPQGRGIADGGFGPVGGRESTLRCPAAASRCAGTNGGTKVSTKAATMVGATGARLALYARVSTTDQTTEPQLHTLRSYAERRGSEAVEFIDHAVSGTKDRRPGLDRMLAAAKRREVSAVVCTKLDRIARSVRHLTTLAAELEALDVALVVLDQAIDTATPSGRLPFNVLGSIAEFERDLIVERTQAGLAAAKRRGVRHFEFNLHRAPRLCRSSCLLFVWVAKFPARAAGSSRPTKLQRRVGPSFMRTNEYLERN